MQPTEHELIVAVDAAARSNYEIHRRVMATLETPGPPFDDLPLFDQDHHRSTVLQVITAVLEALPDRAEAERRRIGTYTLVGDGDSWCHHDRCAGPPSSWTSDCTCGLDDLLEQLREVAPL